MVVLQKGILTIGHINPVAMEVLQLGLFSNFHLAWLSAVVGQFLKQ